MAIRTILTVPDPVLKQVSKPVDAVTDETRALMDDMLETMYAAPGIGLAAVQIGVPVRVIVMDLAGRGRTQGAALFREPGDPRVAGRQAALRRGLPVRPGFLRRGGTSQAREAALPELQGEQIEEWAEGMYAVCIQHEMDHLQGTLFIDHLSRLKRSYAINKVKKAKKRNAA
jgi:peptide deformylase